MNVVALDHWPSSLHGGAPLSTLDVLRGLAARGHRVTLLYTQDGDLLPQYRAFCAGVARVASFKPSLSNPLSLARFARDVVRGARLARAGRGAGPTVVYSNNYRDCTYAVALKRVTGAPVVTHLRVPPPEPPKRLFRQWRAALRRVDRFIAVSHETMARWTDPAHDVPLPAGRVCVVHNGIDTGKFTIDAPAHASAAADMPATCGLNPGDVAIAYVGRVDAVKGVEVLIRAARIVRDTFPGAKLVVAGKGHVSGDAYLRSLASLAGELGIGDDVRFIGHTPRTADLFRAATVSVLPSLWPEPFGRTIPESMACGTPAVGTRTGGIPEILTGDWAAFLADPNDPAGLAAAVVRAIEAKRSDPSLPHRLRQHVLDHFDVTRTIENVERVLLEVTHAKPADSRPTAPSTDAHTDAKLSPNGGAA